MKTVKVIVTKLSEYIGNGSGIMLLNSPGGSTLRWGAGRALVCSALRAYVIYAASA